VSRFVRCELHTHSYHSDGAFDAQSLLDAAKYMEIDALAMTDHNNNCILDTLLPEARACSYPMIPGVELSTFFGHLLLLGTEERVDWRDMTIETPIDEKVSKLRGKGIVAGIAHPFRPGSPLCNGCKWQYKVDDWSVIDYIEVWSGTNPDRNPVNRQAMDWWDSLLNQGYHIKAVSGRDWHKPEGDEYNRMAAFTYLRVDGEITVEGLLDAIRKGDVAVAIDDVPILEADGCGAAVSLLPNRREDEKLEARLCMDGVRTESRPLRRGEKVVFELPENYRWVRAELVSGDKMTGFTNPHWNA